MIMDYTYCDKVEHFFDSDFKLHNSTAGLQEQVFVFTIRNIEDEDGNLKSYIVIQTQDNWKFALPFFREERSCDGYVENFNPSSFRYLFPLRDAPDEEE